ncbi:hypothetical protein N9Y37_09385 [Luminiphilus sp.]|nr:hypothetical protein [Luminiphilus sp.]
MSDNRDGFCEKHWQAMRGCGFFTARVWLGCLDAGINAIKGSQLTAAEPQLVKAFVAGKLFFREHEVTEDALVILTDTTAALYVCLINRAETQLATEVVSSTAHTLSRVMANAYLRKAALNACYHLMSLRDIPTHITPSVQLAMSRYVEHPDSIAH